MSTKKKKYQKPQHCICPSSGVRDKELWWLVQSCIKCLWYRLCCIRRGIKEREVLQCLKLTAPFPTIKNMHQIHWASSRAWRWTQSWAACCLPNKAPYHHHTRSGRVNLTHLCCFYCRNESAVVWCVVVHRCALLTALDHNFMWSESIYLPRACFLHFNTNSLLAGMLGQR